MDKEGQKENKPEDSRTLVEMEDPFEPSPEDFLPTPKPEPTAFEMMPRQGSALPGAVFVSLMTGLSIARWRMPERFADLDVTRQSIMDAHEYWRMLTAIFVHGDMGHLLHNVPVYLFFAWILQAYFGLLAAVVFPLVIGFLSNGLTVYFYDDHVRLLGASGMIYGMVAMWLVLYVYFDRNAWWVKRVARAVGFSLLVMFPQTYDPKVSYLAHISGFAIGLVLAWMSIPIIRRYGPIDFDNSAKYRDMDL